MDEMSIQTSCTRPLFRTILVGFVLACLLMALTSCTSDDAGRPEADESPESTPSEARVGAAKTLKEKPVPMVVRVKRVAGKLGARERRSVERNVRPVVTGWFDRGFLGGRYPRSSFGGAFRTFSREAAALARKHNPGLMTNRRLGPKIESVRPLKRYARLTVLAPRGRAEAVTARVLLRFEAAWANGTRKRVQLNGRLLMTRSNAGQWEIIGYDVARSESAAKKARGR